MYVKEVIRALRETPGPNGESQLRQYPDGTWSFDHSAELWDVPQTIEDAIADRLRPLSPLEREVLDAAAVIANPGRRCRYDTLLRVTGRTEDGVLAALDGLWGRTCLPTAKRQSTHSNSATTRSARSSIRNSRAFGGQGCTRRWPMCWMTSATSSHLTNGSWRLARSPSPHANMMARPHTSSALGRRHCGYKPVKRPPTIFVRRSMPTRSPTPAIRASSPTFDCCSGSLSRSQANWTRRYANSSWW